MDYFRSYLDDGPVFAALLRGVECLLMERAMPFEPPVLDLGCGDGFFSSVLPRVEPWVGLDPDGAALQYARRSRIGNTLVCGDGARMPFPAGAFSTVVSNSVLEHVPPLAETLAEAHRVLRPGGRFLITAPSDRFAGMLLGSSLASAAGWPQLAQAYGDWFNRHSRHHHTFDIGTWQEWLERAGFQVERAHYYLSAPALRAFDLAHYLSVPRLISRKLTGRWMLFPNPLTSVVYDRWLRRYCDPSPVEVGPFVFVEARRRGG